MFVVVVSCLYFCLKYSISIGIQGLKCPLSSKPVRRFKVISEGQGFTFCVVVDIC